MRDPVKRRLSHQRWAAAHRQIVRDRAKKWAAENPERVRKNYLRWMATHLEVGRANYHKRRAMKLQQRCVCCSDVEIQKVFSVAALCGDAAHVDHKTPLRLGGHHCVKNLQALTATEHIEKTKLDNRRIADAKRRSVLLQNWRLAA